MPIQATNEDAVWERTADVLHEFHFNIARENRVARVMETAPRVGSSLLEPWNQDSVGLDSRLESTLQSIRRTVIVTFIPGDAPGTFLVSVQALKEKEDLRGIGANSMGAATFSESTPLDRGLDPVAGQSAASEWIPLGRDAALEQAILERLRVAYAR